MYGQKHTTITMTEQHQLALTALVNNVTHGRFAGPDNATRRLNTTEAAALSEITTALSQVATGTAVTLKPRSEFVPLAEARRTLHVSGTGLRRWLAQRGITAYRSGNYSYLSQADFESLRQWRISLDYPEPQ
ncbi:hypothetical protein [Demequina lutea]|uniref:Helix-turn-helix domain-containing protein n=1 Tax=Demequina lutea TaxID=431489 RepID=A0A7Z0CJU1_9MICO|nr:hypothetical protein [Demequina lutea]NYI41132.1 hypothetical protein [Demequina lutea]